MRAARRILLCLVVISFAFLSFFALASRAQDLVAAARALGRQIVVSVGADKRAALRVQSAADLSPAAVEQARVALEEELRSRGLRLTTEPEVDAVIRVTFSQNLRSFLLIAEIQRGESAEVAIVEVARPAAAPPAAAPETLDLEKALLLEQSEQILDVAALAGEDARPVAMLVLEPGRVALFAREASRWQFQQAAPIPHDRPWPRDLRGRLETDQGAFRAYLPGIACGGTLAPAFTLECRASDEPWPLRAGARRLGYALFAAGRNFFAGKVTLDSGESQELLPFFSLAAIEEQGAWLWVVAGVDGRAHIYAGKTPPATLPAGWGSDIASIHSGCGGGWLLLATQMDSTGDTSTVQAFRYAGGQFVPASRPLQMPGPVTALWPAANGSTAIGVSKNRETQNYEAYSLAIPCGR